MRSVLMFMFVVPAIAFMRLCNDADEVDDSIVVEGAPSSVEVSAQARAPAHGGTVIMADDHAVEVVTHPHEVRAYVVGVDGEPPPPRQTTLIVNVHGDDRGLHPVTLHYDAHVGYFVAPIVEFEPAPGPMNVVLTVGGHPHMGYVTTYEVSPVVVEVEHARPAGARVEVRVNAPPPPSARIDVHIGGPEVHVHGKHRKHRKHRHGHGGIRIRQH